VRGVAAMPFVLIEGTFHVVGQSPDGDSVKFRPRDPDRWRRVPGRPVRANGAGQAQLRLEGIDALETHYQAGVLGTVRQPKALGDAARDELLRLVGVTDVELSADGRVITGAADGTPGFVVTRGTDPYGRPVSFAFAGTPPGGDHDDLFVDRAMVAGSVNRALLAAGLAYPTYYRTLFSDLREELSDAVAAARGAGLGLWPGDRTTLGCTVDRLEAITEEQPLLPKLFRRLVAFAAANGGDPDLSGFLAWLEAAGERVTVLGQGHETGFDDLVEVEGQTVRLREDPLRVIFDPA
jgi:endonuclease YncB( thermonuclease family)